MRSPETRDYRETPFRNVHTHPYNTHVLVCALYDKL